MSNRQFRVLVVDDERAARLYLRKLIGQWSEFVVVGECRTAPEANAALRNQDIDILLLDIQLPGRSGLELIEPLNRDKMPQVIFTTAFDEYAIRAFDLNAIGYLLKPFTGERLRAALDRACSRISRERISEEYERLLKATAKYLQTSSAVSNADSSPADPEDNRSGHGRRFVEQVLVPGQGESIVIPAGEIDWIVARDYYAEIHCGAKCHLVRSSLDWFEAHLDPDVFLRVHRSYVVQTKLIASIRHGKLGQAEILLRNGNAIPVSRRKRAKVTEELRKRSR